MAGLNVAMATGKSSLLARQKELAVVGNNIANANKPGYHKQLAELQSNTPLILGSRGGQMGTGVHVQEVVRRYDLALETSLRQAIGDAGKASLYSDELSKLEQMMNPSGQSIVQNSVSSFAASWQDLSNQPESGQARTQVIERGKILADNINLQRNQMIALRDAIASPAGQGNLANKITILNSYATQVAQLNGEISTLETRRFVPQNANDLRDKRDQLVQDMKKIADISVSEDSSKMYNITLDGTNFVTGTAVSDTVKVTMVANAPTLTWLTAGTTINPTSGESLGLINAFNYIQTTINDLDTFSTTITSNLNTIHTSGFDPSGTAGGNLFSFVANKISFLITDPQKIAASNSATLTGDGGNARDLWDAMNLAIPALGNKTIQSRFDYMIDKVSLDTSNAVAISDGTNSSVTMFQNAITGSTGVNMDEEMMSMLDLQRAYQASAKFINVVDEMLLTTISLKQ